MGTEHKEGCQITEFAYDADKQENLQMDPSTSTSPKTYHTPRPPLLTLELGLGPDRLFKDLGCLKALGFGAQGLGC